MPPGSSRALISPLPVVLAQLPITLPPCLTQASQTLIPPTATVIGSGLGTWSQAKPIIIFVRDYEGRALSTPWLPAAILPTMAWFPLWRMMSGWHKQICEIQRQREKVPVTCLSFRIRQSDSPVDFSLAQIHTFPFSQFDLGFCHLQLKPSSVNTASVFVCFLMSMCVWNKFAPEPHRRVVTKSIFLNIRTYNGTRFRTKENSNKGGKKDI